MLTVVRDAMHLLKVSNCDQHGNAARRIFDSGCVFRKADQPDSTEATRMNAIGIFGGLLAVILAIALVMFLRMRRLTPQMAGYGAQRMCPACGLITPRSKTGCVECGKAFLSDPPVRQIRK